MSNICCSVLKASYFIFLDIFRGTCQQAVSGEIFLCKQLFNTKGVDNKYVMWIGWLEHISIGNTRRGQSAPRSILLPPRATQTFLEHLDATEPSYIN